VFRFSTYSDLSFAQGDEIIYRDYVDLSVAVATPKGLVTPVIRNVESLSFVEFEQELTALGKKVCLTRCHVLCETH
jgi:pyruvate/2-oxoglutarate dehydrogenase complex dihydrolipoamide acyltransferase (E2) component